MPGEGNPNHDSDGKFGSGGGTSGPSSSHHPALDSHPEHAAAYSQERASAAHANGGFFSRAKAAIKAFSDKGQAQGRAIAASDAARTKSYGDQMRGAGVKPGFAQFKK